MKEIKIITYKAFTGKKFNIKEECLDYEQILMEKIAKIIKKECDRCDNCSDCPFIDDEGGCILSDDYTCPCDWEID